MKTGFIHDTSLVSFRLTKKALFALSAAFALLTVSAQAAVTPLSVGPAGAGPLTFDTQPMLADGWSTAQLPMPTGGNNSDITPVDQMNAAVSTNSAAGIVT